MNTETHVNKSQDLIRSCLNRSARPAVYFSSGKDSMVLLYLVLGVMAERGEKPDVIFHQEPFARHKYEFGNLVLSDLGLSMFDYPPSGMAMWEGKEIMAWTNFYQIAQTPDGRPMTLALPKNIQPEEKWKDGFICGRDQIFARPTGSFNYPWDLAFHGHKSCDEDQIVGRVPLKTDLHAPPAGPTTAFPLRHWSNQQIWAYTEENDLPIDRSRYIKEAGGWRELPSKSANSDYFDVCIRCLDRRKELGSTIPKPTVVCPKNNLEIANISDQIRYQDLGAHFKDSYFTPNA